MKSNLAEYTQKLTGLSKKTPKKPNTKKTKNKPAYKALESLTEAEKETKRFFIRLCSDLIFEGEDGFKGMRLYNKLLKGSKMTVSEWNEIEFLCTKYEKEVN